MRGHLARRGCGAAAAPHLPRTRGAPRVAALLLLATVFACGDATGPGADPGPAPFEPIDLSLPWTTSTAEAEGFDTGGLDVALAEAATIENLRALVVVRNGKLVREAYFGPATPDSLYDMRSVTKSVTALLVGIASDRGLLEVGDRMVDWLDSEALRPEHDAIRIEHLLSMTSGIQWTDEANFAPWAQSGRWVDYVLDLPVVAPPGVAFIYNTGGSHLLSVIVGTALGGSALDLAEEALFGPLGIASYSWPTLDGHPAGGVALALRPRDAAKLGQLVLQRGVTGEVRLVSEAWIEAQTATRVALGGIGPFRGGYGYQTWIDDTDDGFLFWGFGGQFVWVVPKDRLVVVTTSRFGGIGYEAAGQQAYAIATAVVRPILQAAR